jgi:hypothetical protein
VRRGHAEIACCSERIEKESAADKYNADSKQGG